MFNPTVGCAQPEPLKFGSVTFDLMQSELPTKALKEIPTAARGGNEMGQLSYYRVGLVSGGGRKVTLAQVRWVSKVDT
eukprot:2034889-Amphidinium_carterae.3